MKLLACILTFIGVSYATKDPCQGAYLKAVHEKCMFMNGGDRVVIENLLQSKEAKDTNEKCFRDCLMRECNYFGDDGKLNPDVPTRISSILHGGNQSNVNPIKETASKCVAAQTYGDSKCNNSEIFVRCLIQKSPVKLKLYNVYD